MKTETTEKARARLFRYAALQRDLDLQIGRLQSMEASAAKAQQRHYVTEIGKIYEQQAASRSASLTDRIQSLAAEENDERERIEKAIQELEKPTAKAVITFRYIERMEWPEVARKICGNGKSCMETDLRKTFRIHGEALASLGEIWAKEKGGDGD